MVGLAPGDPARRRAFRHVQVSVPARTPRTRAFVVTRFAVAPDLAAYDIPLPDGRRTWVLGPRGMIGTLVRRAHGGETVTLHTSFAAITWTISGTGRRAAAALAAPYFPVPEVAGGPPALLHPATVLYRNRQHLAFFAEGHGTRWVFGLAAHNFAGSRRTVVMRYTVILTPKASDYYALWRRAPYWARWIMHRAWAVLAGPLADRQRA